jgi:hypothetical protein
MTTTETHRVFFVRVAEHEAGDPARTAWRARHADATVAVAGAYFLGDIDGEPDQAPDGTFEVHAVASSLIGTVREMLTGHEGMTIVSEEDAPGNGLLRVASKRESR